MTGLPANKTQWFYLSRKELLVLAVGTGIVLVIVNAARGVERLWGRSEVAVVEPGDALPPPAKINVNAAPDYELSMLPGIGPKTAQAIVSNRQQHGPFASLDDMTRVSGIGPATVEAIRPYAACASAGKEDQDAEN
jgi:competence protein ComEA